MRARLAAWIAWFVAGLAIASAIAGAVFLFLNTEDWLTIATGYSAGGAVLGLSFAAAGGFIASRRPHNPLGWIFLIVGLSQGFDTLATQYGAYALVTNPGSLPGGALMAWFASWTWAPGFALIGTLTLLLFPSGRLPSGRWRWMPWTIAVAILFMVMPTAVVLWPLRGPILVGDVNSAELAGGPVLWLQGLAILLVILCMVASTTSLIVRFHRSRRDERQQLKWLAYAGLITVITLVIILAIDSDLSGDSFRESLAWSLISFVLLFTVIPSIPMAVGIAIFKYRLYDIDIIIRRTLVYAVLTAALALVYFGNVVLLQSVFSAVGGRQSTVAIVLSTLAIAALFSSLRRRVQDVIDRRFYRGKYDAEKTLAAFATTARDEVELERLAAALLHVIQETMLPAEVSLWLRPTVPLQGKRQSTSESN